MLVRTNTLWNDLAEVQNEFDRLFRRGLGDGVSGHFPPVNIAENDDAYVIQARVPGLAKDDIAIELEGRKLTISGEHKRVEAEYDREERATGRFHVDCAGGDGDGIVCGDSMHRGVHAHPSAN